MPTRDELIGQIAEALAHPRNYPCWDHVIDGGIDLGDGLRLAVVEQIAPDEDNEIPPTWPDVFRLAQFDQEEPDAG